MRKNSIALYLSLSFFDELTGIEIENDFKRALRSKIQEKYPDFYVLVELSTWMHEQQISIYNDDGSKNEEKSELLLNEIEILWQNFYDSGEWKSKIPNFTTAAAIIERSKKLGITVNLWDNMQFTRIYVQQPRGDLKVWLDIKWSVKYVTGFSFHAKCTTPQHENWVRSQEEEAKKTYIALFYAAALELYKDADMSTFGEDIKDMVKKAIDFEKSRLEHTDNN